MPELPEVETIVQDLLRAGLVGKKVVDAHVKWHKTIATSSPQEFIFRITGQSINAIKRAGKFLVFSLSKNDFLLIHLRMTGKLRFVSSTTSRAPHEHVILVLNNDMELRFHDTRKFGRWYLVSDAQIVLGALGLDPLEENFNLKEFQQHLSRRARQLKPLLLDQTVLAGLGNIYVDEALWEAKLHPQRLSNALKPGEIKKLFSAIITVLKRGLLASGTTLGKGLGNFYRLDGSAGKHQQILKVFRRTGLPCPRCGTTIIRLIVGQRSTHVCPVCQSQV